jgi:hypothetical protein
MILEGLSFTVQNRRTSHQIQTEARGTERAIYKYVVVRLECVI